MPESEAGEPRARIISYSGLVRSSRIVLLSTVLAVALAAAVLWVGGEDRREAIRVEENRVVVTNLGDADWTEVEIWLNDWYRAQVPRLTAGQRLDVPLTAFTAGYDRPYEPARQAPFGIEVTARGADGRDVTLTWGQGRRR